MKNDGEVGTAVNFWPNCSTTTPRVRRHTARGTDVIHHVFHLARITPDHDLAGVLARHRIAISVAHQRSRARVW